MLAGPERSPLKGQVEIPVGREGSGTLPGVDLDDTPALWTSPKGVGDLLDVDVLRRRPGPSPA